LKNIKEKTKDEGNSLAPAAVGGAIYPHDIETD